MEVRVEFDSEGAERLLKEAPEALADTLALFFQHAAFLTEGVMGTVIDERQKKDPVGGGMKGSIGHEFVDGGVRVGPRKDYAGYVNDGTSPHWPPHEPLVDWVVRVFGVSGKEADRAAYAMQAKIAREGTPAMLFIEETATRIREPLEDLMENLIDRALDDLGAAS